jgi:hypothetical protein
MRHARRLRYLASALALCLLLPPKPLRAQADIQTTVRDFLQSWYVDRKSAEQLKSYIAKDTGFKLEQNVRSSSANTAAASTDPVSQLFTRAFTQGPVGVESVTPKTLSEAIEYAPAKRPAAVASSGQQNCLATIEFAVCKPEQLPKGSVLPANKPSSKDPVANYLWHLNQDYKNKLYIVLYSTKGVGLLRETAILYWIQEGNSWKLAAFEGTNW